MSSFLSTIVSHAHKLPLLSELSLSQVELAVKIAPIAAFLAHRCYKNMTAPADVKGDGKFVLISGCDSGFGNGVAKSLDRLGFVVFAGCLTEAGRATLQQELSSRAVCFILDITKSEDIEAAVALVSSRTTTLHALVNNAGIGLGGLIEWTSMDTHRRVMDVNYFAHVAMTRSLLPLLTATADSRIINLCSVAGFVAGAGMSAYAASKFALEGFSDTLRREMTAWDVKVIIVEPGFFRTAIVDGPQGRAEGKASSHHSDRVTALYNSLPAATAARYGNAFAAAVAAKAQNDPLIAAAQDPILVVNDITTAATTATPAIRYRPGFQAKILFPLSQLPVAVLDGLMRMGVKHMPRPAAYVEQQKQLVLLRQKQEQQQQQQQQSGNRVPVRA